MKRLWQISTLIFIFQMIAGGITYLVTGDLMTAIVGALAAAAAAVVVVATAGDDDGVAFAFAATAAATAAATTAAAFAAFVTTAFAATAAAFAATAFAAFVTTAFAATAAAAVDGGPFWARVFCALPLGVGTVIGGVLILFGVGKAKEAVEDGQ